MTSEAADRSVRSCSRARAVHSRTDDPVERIAFSDGHWVSVRGGGAAIEAASSVVYLALSLRNVGAGIAVLQAWQAHDSLLSAVTPPTPVDQLRTLTRDQYIAGGNVGVWQGALRDPPKTTVGSAPSEPTGTSTPLPPADRHVTPATGRGSRVCVTTACRQRRAKPGRRPD